MKARSKGKWLKSSVFVVASALLFTSISLLTPAPSVQANVANPAASAPHPSKFSELIDWIDWSKNDADAGSRKLDIKNPKTHKYTADIPYGNKKYSVKNVRQVGDSKLITRCSVNRVFSKQYEGEDVPITLYSPGGYKKDPFDDFYGSDRLVAIGRSKKGQSTMDVSCSAALLRSGETAEVPIPIEGLVFADGESTNRQRTKITTKVKHRGKTKTIEKTIWGLRELFEITPDVPKGNEFNWKLLEYYPGDGCAANQKDKKNNQGNIEIRRGGDYGNYRKDDAGNYLYEQSSLKHLKKSDNVRVRGLDGPCGTRQTMTTVYAEGATGAYIDLYGAGGNYVAVGVVLGADLSDAPEGYPTAGTVVKPLITGADIPPLVGRNINVGDDLDGELTENDTTTTHPEEYVNRIHNSIGDAKVSYDNPPYLGSHGPDGDIDQARNFIADDSTVIGTDNVPEEDALVDESHPGRHSLLVSAAPAKYELNVKCAADQGDKDTHVRAWLDWNGNKRFESAEQASAICPKDQNAKAKLEWTVTPEMLSGLTNHFTPSALRLIASTDTKNTPTGMYKDGEVEDHAVTLVKPQVALTQQLVTENGALDPNQTPDLLKQRELTAIADPSNSFALKGNQEDRPELSISNDSGKAAFDFIPTSEQAFPLDVRDQLASPSHTLTFTEKPRKNYGLADFPESNCTVSTGPESLNGWSLPENRDPYPFASASDVKISSTGGRVSVTGMNAAAVVNCAVKNQPDGTFKITPKVKKEDNVSATVDPNIRFSGTWTCESNGKTVSGEWGPISADETWSFEATESSQRVPLNANCKISQTKITDAGAQPDSTRPVKGVADAELYSWGDVEYAPVATPANSGQSGVAVAGNDRTATNVPEFIVTNPVVKKSLTTVKWEKVDPFNRPLKGAKFKLTGPNAFSLAEFSDCVGENEAACSQSVDKDHRAGYFKIDQIPVGDGYTLTETEAPVGYKIGDDPIPSFNVASGDVASGVTLPNVVNKPKPANELPMLPLTGGTSTDHFIIAGGLVGIFSFILAAIALRQKRRAPVVVGNRSLGSSK